MDWRDLEESELRSKVHVPVIMERITEGKKRELEERGGDRRSGDRLEGIGGH